MLILVTGGSASGKSEYAGHLAERIAEEDTILYIATLRDQSPESKQKVERHRMLRRKGHYLVVECFSLAELKQLTDSFYFRSEKQVDFRYRVVLFDSLDAFTAEVLFGGTLDDGKRPDIEFLADETAAMLAALGKTADYLIVVSDALYSDGFQYDGMTQRYMQYTAGTERRLAFAAETVVEVICGIPLLLKGENHECLQISCDNDVTVYENPDASD